MKQNRPAHPRDHEKSPVEKNLDDAEGRGPKAHAAGAADVAPAARGQYGVAEENMEAEDFYAASNSHKDEPEAENLK